MADLIVCSHRGPVQHAFNGDDITATRGGGGLVGAVRPVMEGHGGTWIAAALTDADRTVPTTDEGGYTVRLLDLPQDAHAAHYEEISNEYLWFLFHYLFDVASEPRFGHSFFAAWSAYDLINDAFADAVAETGGTGAVLVHDYHLMLVGAKLRRRGIDLPLVYFHHTPWSEPDYFGVLPEAIRTQILTGLLAFDVVGFHARRWADAFLRCCQRLAGASVAGDEVIFDGRTTTVVVAPVPLDAEAVRDEAADPRTRSWMAHHEDVREDRKLLLRVDRIDLSKNPLRGFLAYEALLDERPELADETVFLALMYPSRLTVARYRRYFADCLGVVRRINERHERAPVVLHFEDDFHRSLGAMCMADALLVNPVFDGLNLVAKEAALVNERDGVVLLSRNAGAFEEIGQDTVAIDPFDVRQTANAIGTAFDMSTEERAARAEHLREVVARRTPMDWANELLSALPGS